MDTAMVDYLGWIATAVFVGSYLCKRADTLKRVQMVGALMWVVYGLLISATPVVAANLLVFSAAGWALLAQSRGSGLGTRGRWYSEATGTKSKRLVASE